MKTDVLPKDFIYESYFSYQVIFQNIQKRSLNFKNQLNFIYNEVFSK